MDQDPQYIDQIVEMATPATIAIMHKIAQDTKEGNKPSAATVTRWLIEGWRHIGVNVLTGTDLQQLVQAWASNGATGTGDGTVEVRG